ncbi:hypothetical protein K438DRAFT_2086772, partial [Mycena galopus ATCC 62051]
LKKSKQAAHVSAQPSAPVSPLPHLKKKANHPARQLPMRSTPTRTKINHTPGPLPIIPCARLPHPRRLSPHEHEMVPVEEDITQPQRRTPPPQRVAQAGDIGQGAGRGAARGLVPLRGVGAAVFEFEREVPLEGEGVVRGEYACMTAYSEPAALLRVRHKRQLQLRETRKQREQRAKLRLPSGSSAAVTKRTVSDAIFGSARTPCSSATRFLNWNPASSAMRVRVGRRANMLEHGEDRCRLRGGEVPEDAAIVAREGAHAGEGGEGGEGAVYRRGGVGHHREGAGAREGRDVRFGDGGEGGEGERREGGAREERDPEIVHVVVVAGDETRDAQGGGGARRDLLAGRDCAAKGLDTGKSGQRAQIGHAALCESNPRGARRMRSSGRAASPRSLPARIPIPAILVVQPGGARAHVGCDPRRGVEIQARQGVGELRLRRLELVRIRVVFEFGETKRARWVEERLRCVSGGRWANTSIQSSFGNLGGSFMGEWGEEENWSLDEARGKRRNVSDAMRFGTPPNPIQATYPSSEKNVEVMARLAI